MLVRLAAIALVVGCSDDVMPVTALDAGEFGIDAGRDRDAGEINEDAGELDLDAGGRDAGEADDDAGRPRRDAGPDDDAGGTEVCDLYLQTGCRPGTPAEGGEACRLSEMGVGGEAQCEPAGLMSEGNNHPRPCRVDGVDQCQRGLFCAHVTVCRRYCQPGLPPECPLGRAGEEQRCIEDERLPIPYCSGEFPP